MKRFALGLMALSIAACGGGEPAADDASMEQPAEAPAAEAPAAEAEMPAGELTMPDWYQMDGNNVTLDITAGLTDAGNYWNYNGYQNGELTITVPEGANVTINFVNNDPNMPHSIGVHPAFDSPPASPSTTPVFEGAISENPTSMTDATMPNGDSETITFTASEAGEYTLVCYIPAHTISGMWVRFVVSAEGEAGAMMSSM
ncbi:MAG TPA: sulfocyanin-like copper-binding protein [Longimicrobiales bacterium]|nr:sulfocyanin-like copper-binding protein [Longimicrobiales bacterium]